MNPCFPLPPAIIIRSSPRSACYDSDLAHLFAGLSGDSAGEGFGHGYKLCGGFSSLFSRSRSGLGGWKMARRSPLSLSHSHGPDQSHPPLNDGVALAAGRSPQALLLPPPPRRQPKQ